MNDKDKLISKIEQLGLYIRAVGVKAASIAMKIKMDIAIEIGFESQSTDLIGHFMDKPDGRRLEKAYAELIENNTELKAACEVENLLKGKEDTPARFITTLTDDMTRHLEYLTYKAQFLENTLTGLEIRLKEVENLITENYFIQMKKALANNDESEKLNILKTYLKEVGNILDKYGSIKISELCTAIDEPMANFPQEVYQYFDLKQVNEVHYTPLNTLIDDRNFFKKRKWQLVKNGDVLIYKNDKSQLKACFIPQKMDGFLCSSNFLILRLNGTITPQVLVCIINSSTYFEQLSHYELTKNDNLKCILDIKVPNINKRIQTYFDRQINLFIKHYLIETGLLRLLSIMETMSESSDIETMETILDVCEQEILSSKYH